ncbi:hypothetical protein LBMAG47_17170 [Planctomycetia bacterium]|nr:hypothetical protein LBMAG47_17170 [Planctomycetia bacterium]
MTSIGGSQVGKSSPGHVVSRGGNRTFVSALDMPITPAMPLTPPLQNYSRRPPATWRVHCVAAFERGGGVGVRIASVSASELMPPRSRTMGKESFMAIARNSVVPP